MGIYLKEVSMPKGDEFLRVDIEPDGTVTVSRHYTGNKDPNLQYIELRRVITEAASAVPCFHGDLVDINELSRLMYHEAFENDTPLQKWESGCWIRYKLFENCREQTRVIIEREE